MRNAPVGDLVLYVKAVTRVCALHRLTPGTPRSADVEQGVLEATAGGLASACMAALPWNTVDALDVALGNGWRLALSVPFQPDARRRAVHAAALTHGQAATREDCKPK